MKVTIASSDKLTNTEHVYKGRAEAISLRNALATMLTTVEQAIIEQGMDLVGCSMKRGKLHIIMEDQLTNQLAVEFTLGGSN